MGEIIQLGSENLVDMFGNSLQLGDLVNCYTGWQLYGTSPAIKVRKLVPQFYENLPPSYGFGVLGMPGLTGTTQKKTILITTAYFGILEVGKPQPGETVVVSGAAGAVGSIVVTLDLSDKFTSRSKLQKSKVAKSLPLLDLKIN